MNSDSSDVQLIISNVCDYGTVVASLNASQMRKWESREWLELESLNNFGMLSDTSCTLLRRWAAEYFETEIQHYFGGQAIMKAVKTRRQLQKILPLLRNLLGPNSKIEKMLSRKAQKFAKEPRPSTHKMSTRRKKIDYRPKRIFKDVKKSTELFVQDALVVPRPALPTMLSPTPRTPLTWHDVMIADLMDVSDIYAEDLEDLRPVPIPVPHDQVVVDGKTANWVDLPTYLAFMQSNNSQLSPSAAQLTPEYFATTSYWFLSVDDPTKEEAPILAWMLLSLLISNDVATELMTAFPLNPNGPSSATLDPYMVGDTPATSLNSSLGVWSMIAQNFRALIVVPNTPGAVLEVQCFYFELAPPPPDLNNISNSDFMTWTVPFSNSVWSTGQVNFQHTGNLRVKIIWPLYLDALTLCNFDGNITVSCIAS